MNWQAQIYAIKKLAIMVTGSIYGYLLSFIMPVRWFLLIVVIVVLVDLYAGTKAARKRGEKIKDDGIRKAGNKITNYFIIILISEAMRLVFFKDINITYVVSGIIAMAEYYSIAGHVSELTGLDIVTALKEYIGDKIKVRIKNGGKNDNTDNDGAIEENSTVNDTDISNASS